MAVQFLPFPNDPNAAPDSTIPYGISGGNIVGIYSDSAHTVHGFEYNGSSFTNIDDPVGIATRAWGISGSLVFGNYTDAAGNGHGVIYDGSTYRTLDFPGAAGVFGTELGGAIGGDIFGSYTDSTGAFHSFVYDGTSFHVWSGPSELLSILGPDFGHVVVGGFLDSAGLHGFAINGSSFIQLDEPNAAKSMAYPAITAPVAASGGRIIGDYRDSSGMDHGFIYSASSYATLDNPMQTSGMDEGTWLTGIDGDEVIGFYSTGGTRANHGFIALIPEPSSNALFGIGLLCFAAFNCRRGRATV